MAKFKFTKDMRIGLGLGIAALVSYFLGNEKEKSARESLKSELKDEIKSEVKDEVMKEILKEKN